MYRGGLCHPFSNMIVDYYDLIEDLLGEEYAAPRPQELMYDGECTFGEIKVVDEESNSHPEWRVFKIKDTYFKITCGYHPEYGYDIDYECATVTPKDELILVRQWYNE